MTQTSFFVMNKTPNLGSVLVTVIIKLIISMTCALCVIIQATTTINSIL